MQQETGNRERALARLTVAAGAMNSPLEVTR
jgi:hypothetical protein